MPPERHTFRAMGTDVTLLLPEGTPSGAVERAATIVERIFTEEELRFSRFRGNSELSRVNARAGGWVDVSPRFAQLVRLALTAAIETCGLFDPTVLGAMVSTGYDRDFDEVLAGARGRLSPPVPCGRWREVEIEGDMLRMPEGVGLDLGGIAKGWTVDRAAESAAEDLPWALVNAGGDLRLAGDCPDGGIDVSIEDPTDRAGEVVRITVECGAVATSSVTRRTWGPGLHHLIDPRTGLPADTEIVQASVWAETCSGAEVRSKLALLDGTSSLERFPAVLVLACGDVVMNIGRRTPQEVTA